MNSSIPLMIDDNPVDSGVESFDDYLKKKKITTSDEKKNKN